MEIEAGATPRDLQLSGFGRSHSGRTDGEGCLRIAGIEWRSGGKCRASSQSWLLCDFCDPCLGAPAQGWGSRSHPRIVSDSKSGVSGAGKEPTSKTHFVSVADNLSAYSVFSHRHVGEIVEQLGLSVDELIFTPHLLPIPRGILSTIYLHLNRRMTPLEVESCFRNFYSGKHWVRVFQTPKLPQVQFSLQTNYCDLGFCLAEDGRRLVLISCIDNLLKGAAGQAVQNMNLMYGWAEDEGLQ